MPLVSHEVTVARVDQISAVADALQRAFHEDPLLCWVFDRPVKREAAARAFFRWWVRNLIDQEQAFTTPSVQGAAVWALPNQWRVGLWEELKMARSVWSAGKRPLTKARGTASIEAAHPKEPHLYLALLGVDPAHQGTGLGSALLAPGLQLCDEERWPAYLETSTARNVDFYGRLGFAVVDELTLPLDGPTIWRMWREPQ